MRKNEVQQNIHIEIWRRIIILAVNKFNSGNSEIIDKIAEILRINEIQCEKKK